MSTCNETWRMHRRASSCIAAWIDVFASQAGCVVGSTHAAVCMHGTPTAYCFAHYLR